MRKTIIPDINGQADKLDALLARLGWVATPAGWRMPEPGESLVFLGDFIDRGPENARVLARVRSLVDGGHARALMGNHELNAIHYHTEVAGRPLRPRSAKNTRQHARFLEEFPLGAAATQDAIGWFRTLPLYLEDADFRAVHACWESDTIDRLEAAASGGVLSAAQLNAAADPAQPLFDPVDVTLKGREVPVPDGHRIALRDGTTRDRVRIRWWMPAPARWDAFAVSVPDPSDLPAGAVPEDLVAASYPTTGKPVFFGHYWMRGQPVIETPNALCLDYSAGLGGPLVAYRHEGGKLSADRLVVV